MFAAGVSDKRAAASRANLMRIQIVERCFGSQGTVLAQQGRVLLGEGILKKVCRKTLSLRKILLFNDIMVSPIHAARALSLHLLPVYTKSALLLSQASPLTSVV